MPEETEARRASQREYDRNRRATLTPEEREAIIINASRRGYAVVYLLPCCVVLLCVFVVVDQVRGIQFKLTTLLWQSLREACYWTIIFLICIYKLH